MSWFKTKSGAPLWHVNLCMKLRLTDQTTYNNSKSMFFAFCCLINQLSISYAQCTPKLYCFQNIFS